MSAIHSICDTILKRLTSFCPPPSQRQHKKIRYQIIQTQLEGLAQELNTQIYARRIGWIGRIKLIYRLQKQLHQNQYEPELVRRLTTLFIFAAVQRPNS